MSRSFIIGLAALCTCAALVLQGGVARAQEKRVAVLDFEGPSASSVEAQVTRALKARREIDLVSTREVRRRAQRMGNRMATDRDFRELAEKLSLSAFIEGKTDKRGRYIHVTVIVRNASSGEILHEETWKKRRSQLKQLRPLVWDALSPAISESSPPGKRSRSRPEPEPEPEPEPVRPPEPEPEPDPEPEEDEIIDTKPKPQPTAPIAEEVPEEEPEEPPAAEPPPSTAAVNPDQPVLVLSLGPRLTWRNLRYEGETNFNSYKNAGSSPAFSLPLSVQYYPGAHVTSGWISNLGLDLDFDYALGLRSNLGGRKLKTTAYELGAGAIFRVPLSDFQPRLRIGYVRHVFDVAVPRATLLPGVSYSAVRIGVGTAIKFVDWFSFDASFGYLFVLDTGELQTDRFGKDVTAGAWEAGAAFVMRFDEYHGLRFGVDYRRYKYDFPQPEPNSLEQLPSTGTDGYMRLGLQYIFSLPGSK